jgi:DNA-binding transcriptional MerR regulator
VTDNTYYIGAVAKLLGISSECIRLYEHTGILESRRSGTGAYRMYDHQDITALMRARTYHNCGFTTRTISRLLNSDSGAEISEIYRQQIEETESRIQYLQSVSACLRESLDLMDAAERHADRITVCMRPAMYRLPFMENDDLSICKEAYPEFHRWMSLLPVTFPAQENNWSDLNSGSFSSQSALGIFRKDAVRFHIGKSRFTEYCPSVRCLYTIIRVEKDMSSPKAAFEKLLDKVAAQHLTVTGNILSRTFLSMNKSSNYSRYRQIWLPVAVAEKS